MWPDDSDKTVSHETVYNAIYLHPRGELKRELIACLRHHSQVRKARSRGVDRRGQIKAMQSIHIRPPEGKLPKVRRGDQAASELLGHDSV